MYDCIIIGKGPAGLSAALYTARAGLRTLVLAKGTSKLELAEQIDNYLGFEKGISGTRLLDEGERQALRFGVEFINDEVVQISSGDADSGAETDSGADSDSGAEAAFVITGTEGRYVSQAVIIATGWPYKRINIANLDKFEGKGVSYCTLCDGFFYRDMKVGIIGNKDFALHEAAAMKELAKEVKIYTNGKKLELSKSESMMRKTLEFPLNTDAIASFEGADFLERIRFVDGSEESVDGVFLALESASGSDFARQLGILTDGIAITVDKDQKTNVEGIYAAGDCTGGVRQISVAAAQGAIAGKNVAEYVRISSAEVATG